MRPQNAAVAASQLVRQFTAPAVGSERVFVCIVAGTTANTTDATWVLTRGAKTTDGTATWMECTGQAALNGDLTNTSTWTQVKAATPAVLGQIIKRSNNASYQICTTAGAMSASEPAFSNTAGVTTTDTTAVWTSLGPVGNFTGGQAPFARLVAACASTWFAAGNTVYVGDNHAESQATTITMQPAGSASVIGKILCHNRSGSYPPAASDLTTGATISTITSGNIGFSPSSAGGFYIYGLSFKVAVGSSGNQNFALSTFGNFTYLDNCSIELVTTGSVATINLGSAVNAWVIVFSNTKIKFANVTQIFSPQSAGQFFWQNTGQILLSGSSVPNNLLASNTAVANIDYILEAIDLSQLTGNIISNVGASTGSMLVKDCKLNASTTVPTMSSSGFVSQLVRCDSGATGYKSARYTYEGTETTETSIVRTGGAVDPLGQVQSRKIVTTANTQWLRPFRAEPYAIWNTTTGSNVTVTVYGTINAGAVPNNDDIWMEVEYLGSSATPLGTIVTTTKASLLASNAAVASDGSSWDGGGSGAGWSPFKLTVSVTPGMAGVIEARIRVAKAATTYYIDPMPVLT
jgi:hypothetical protein